MIQTIFAENTAYAVLASVGTLLYLIKMILFLIGGDVDGEGDLSDVDGGMDEGDGGDSFSLVSTQSILAFLMGTGWIGLAAQREWEMNDMNSLFAAVGFGIVMMLFSSFLTFKIKKLNYTPKIDIKEAIGKRGRAYTNVPAKGEGIGQVELTVGDKLQILQASSNDGAIKAFDNIIVENVDDSGNLIIKKI